MDIQKEVFKPIMGYEGIYEIGSFGSVKSLVRRYRINERFLKPQKNADGYLTLILCRDGIMENKSVHRLVAENFFKDRNEHVNHKNGIRDDNRIENLEWVTVSQNLQHSYTVLGRKSAMKGKVNNGTKKLFGANNYKSKKIECFKDGVSLGVFESINLAVKHFGFSRGVCLSRVAHGKRKSHMGYNFKFV